MLPLMVSYIDSSHLSIITVLLNRKRGAFTISPTVSVCTADFESRSQKQVGLLHTCELLLCSSIVLSALIDGESSYDYDWPPPTSSSGGYPKRVLFDVSKLIGAFDCLASHYLTPNWFAEVSWYKGRSGG